MTRNTLVYDDDCGFCTWWADFIEARSDLRLVGFSELGPELLDRLPDDYERSSHLVTDDQVYSGGKSIEEALARSEVDLGTREVVDFLRHFEDYERLREHGYRYVANNRTLFGRLMSKTPPARREED